MKAGRRTEVHGGHGLWETSLGDREPGGFLRARLTRPPVGQTGNSLAVRIGGDLHQLRFSWDCPEHVSPLGAKLLGDRPPAPLGRAGFSGHLSAASYSTARGCPHPAVLSRHTHRGDLIYSQRCKVSPSSRVNPRPYSQPRLFLNLSPKAPSHVTVRSAGQPRSSLCT